MTKEQMRNAYYEIRKEVAHTMTPSEQMKVIDIHCWLMAKKGYEDYGLNARDKKQKHIDFLESYKEAYETVKSLKNN